MTEADKIRMTEEISQQRREAKRKEGGGFSSLPPQASASELPPSEKLLSEV